MFVSDIRTVQGSGRTCLRRRWLHSSWALFKLVLQLARTDLMLDTNRRMTFPIYFILIHLNHLLRILILYTRTERLSFMYCTCTCHKASKILFWGMYEVWFFHFPRSTPMCVNVKKVQVWEITGITYCHSFSLCGHPLNKYLKCTSVRHLMHLVRVWHTKVCIWVLVGCSVWESSPLFSPHFTRTLWSSRYFSANIWYIERNFTSQSFGDNSWMAGTIYSYVFPGVFSSIVFVSFP